MPIAQLPRRIVDVRSESRWVEVVEDGDVVQVTIGRVGNRMADDQRSRRRVWRVGTMGGRLEVLGVFPVRELLTHRLGDVTASLDDALVAAGAGPDDGEAIRGAASRLAGGRQGTLAGVLWPAAFPLLGPVVERGSALGSVPEALDPLLRADSVRAGVRRLYGRPTRPLVRAVATRLLPADGGPPAFDPLVVAAMAAGTCGPERLVDIVATDPHRPGEAGFTVADVHRARHVLGRQRPAEIDRLLRRALADPGGIRRLREHLDQWSPPRPPAPPPRPAPPPHPRQPQRPAEPPVRPRPRPAEPRPIVHPPAFEAAEGRVVAGLTVRLPRTTADLERWGVLFGNCLASYGPAVVAGRSRVVGLVRAHTLAVVVEITPGGTIRQIEGPGNRVVTGEVGRRIARELIALRLASADGRSGRPMLAPD